MPTTKAVYEEGEMIRQLERGDREECWRASLRCYRGELPDRVAALTFDALSVVGKVSTGSCRRG